MARPLAMKTDVWSTRRHAYGDRAASRSADNDMVSLIVFHK
jgi:hypothetical protein